MTGMIDFVEADKTGEPFQKESKVRKRQEDACMCCSGGGMAQQTNRRYCTKMTDIINRACSHLAARKEPVSDTDRYQMEKMGVKFRDL